MTKARCLYSRLCCNCVDASYREWPGKQVLGRVAARSNLQGLSAQLRRHQRGRHRRFERKTNAALRDGGFVLVNETGHDVLSYLRKPSEGTAVLVALNLSAGTRKVSFNLGAQGVRGGHAVTLLSSYAKPGESADLKGVVLPAYGWVGQIQ
jgi:hypothetical protein